jgi:hypothetical protein
VGVPRQTGERSDFARAMALHDIVSALAVAGLTADDMTQVDILS